MTNHRCHACGCPNLETMAQPSPPLALVSSDIQPVEGTVEYLCCQNCGLVQKAVTRTWLEMTDRIYAGYRNLETEHPRTSAIIDHLQSVVALPREGRLLDYGCGAGHLMTRYGSKQQCWKCVGVERGETIPIDKPFDIVVMSHVLEHIVDPVATLGSLRDVLAPGGHIIIAVPDLSQNPLDLIVADHCSHFTARSLLHVIHAAGLSVKSFSTVAVAKELTAICSPESMPSSLRLLGNMRSRIGAAWISAELERWKRGDAQ